MWIVDVGNALNWIGNVVRKVELGIFLSRWKLIKNSNRKDALVVSSWEFKFLGEKFESFVPETFLLSEFTCLISVDQMLSLALIVKTIKLIYLAS